METELSTPSLPSTHHNTGYTVFRPGQRLRDEVNTGAELYCQHHHAKRVTISGRARPEGKPLTELNMYCPVYTILKPDRRLECRHIAF